MIDSTNPRIMADNIRHLTAGEQADASAIAVNAAAIADNSVIIGKLTTYSNDEFDTGKRYGDKVVYGKLLSGNTPTDSNLDISLTFDKLIFGYGEIELSGVFYDVNRVMQVVGNSTYSYIRFVPPIATYQDKPFIYYIEYIKSASPSPNLAPAPDDTRSIEPEVREEEPEAEPIEEPVVEVKKTTRKKTTTTE